MRSLAVALLATSVAISTGCFDGEYVDFTFDNRTDARICYYLSSEGAADAHCNQEIKPFARTSWRPRCAYGSEAEKVPVTVILTVADGGRRIYDQTLRCRAWQNSDATFVIEKQGDQFYVSDPISR